MLNTLVHDKLVSMGLLWVRYNATVVKSPLRTVIFACNIHMCVMGIPS
jgi:hypothetical protein